MLVTSSACVDLDMLGGARQGTLPPDVHARPSARDLADNPCGNHDVSGCMNACRANDAHACNMVGVLLEFDTTGHNDPALASGFYRRACDSTYYPGCNNLAWLYLGGHGVPQDKPEAMRLFYYAYDGAQVACLQGDVTGCMMAGELLEEGRGVPQDDSQALAMYDRACAGGEASGCDRAATLR